MGNTYMQRTFLALQSDPLKTRLDLIHKQATDHLTLVNAYAAYARKLKLDASKQLKLFEDLAINFSDLQSKPGLKPALSEKGNALEDDTFRQLEKEVKDKVKSFEDELSTTTAQDSGETQPDLGYLFEASDDELGLPPPSPPPPPSALPPPSSEETEETVTELVRASSDSLEVGELCGFEEQVTGFGAFELDDGLFEYSDVCLDSGDLFSWRPEILAAE